MCKSLIELTSPNSLGKVKLVANYDVDYAKEFNLFITILVVLVVLVVIDAECLVGGLVVH